MKDILEIYRLLYRRFGPQYWWPGRTRLEIIIGAILTQNTAWSNVEKAIANLRRKGLIKVKELSLISEKELAKLIRPAGYYNIKANRIKFFLKFLNDSYNNSVKILFKTETNILRSELLNIKGIGPETADSILLYAGKKPMFVIDTYTKRIFSRHGFINEDASYNEVQQLILKNLPVDVRLYNEYHALLVKTGKDLCRFKNPLCDECPIRRKKKWLKTQRQRNNLEELALV